MLMVELPFLLSYGYQWPDPDELERERTEVSRLLQVSHSMRFCTFSSTLSPNLSQNEVD